MSTASPAAKSRVRRRRYGSGRAATPVGGEVDAAVRGPARRFVHPPARRKLGNPAAPEVEEEQVRRPAPAIGGPVGGEDQAAPIGAGTRIEVLVAVGGERLEFAAG